MVNLFYQQEIFLSIDSKSVLLIANLFYQSIENLFYEKKICSIYR